VNAACGDTVTMYVRLAAGAGDGAGAAQAIDAVRWEGQGCAISQAATSMLSEAMEGMTPDALAALRQEDVEKLLGFPVAHTRSRCALLGLRTAQAGLAAHRGEAGDNAATH
jgi:nitrogen fixation NifU-like protein